MVPSSWAAYSQHYGRLGTAVNPTGNDPMVGSFSTTAPPILIPHHAHQADQSGYVNTNLLAAHGGYDPIMGATFQAAAAAAAAASKTHLAAAAAAQSNLFKAVASKETELREGFARAAAIFSPAPHPAHTSWRHNLMTPPSAPSPFGVLPHEAVPKTDERGSGSAYKNSLPNAQENLSSFASSQISHNFIGGQSHFATPMLEKNSSSSSSYKPSPATSFTTQAQAINSFQVFSGGGGASAQHMDLTARSEPSAAAYSSVITRASGTPYQDVKKSQSNQYTAGQSPKLSRSSPSPISPASYSSARTSMVSSNKQSNVPSPQQMHNMLSGQQQQPVVRQQQQQIPQQQIGSQRGASNQGSSRSQSQSSSVQSMQNNQRSQSIPNRVGSQQSAPPQHQMPSPMQNSPQLHHQQSPQSMMQNSPQSVHYSHQNSPQQQVHTPLAPPPPTNMQRNPPPAHQGRQHHSPHGAQNSLGAISNQLMHNMSGAGSQQQQQSQISRHGMHNVQQLAEQPVYETLQKPLAPPPSGAYLAAQQQRNCQQLSRAELQAHLSQNISQLSRHINASPAKTSLVDESLFNGLEELASAASLVNIPSKDIADSIPPVVEGTEYTDISSPPVKKRKSTKPKKKSNDSAMSPPSPTVLHQMQAPPAAHSRQDPRSAISLMPMMGHMGQLMGNSFMSNPAMQLPLMMQSQTFCDPFLGNMTVGGQLGGLSFADSDHSSSSESGIYDQRLKALMKASNAEQNNAILQNLAAEAAHQHQQQQQHHHHMQQQQQAAAASPPKKKSNVPSIEDDLGFLAELPPACNIACSKKPSSGAAPVAVAAAAPVANPSTNRVAAPPPSAADAAASKKAADSGYLDIFIQFAQGKPPSTLESASSGPGVKPVRPYIPPPPKPASAQPVHKQNDDQGTKPLTQRLPAGAGGRGRPPHNRPPLHSAGWDQKDAQLAAHLQSQEAKRNASKRNCKPSRRGSNSDGDYSDDPPDLEDSDEDPVWTPFSKDADDGDDGRGKRSRGKFNYPNFGIQNGGKARSESSSKNGRKYIEDSDSRDSDKQPKPGRPLDAGGEVNAGGYKKGDFLLEDADPSSGAGPTLWRVDRGNLLQKFEMVQREGRAAYKNSNTYSSWQALNKNKFHQVSRIKTVDENKTTLIVEITGAADDAAGVQSQTLNQQVAPPVQQVVHAPPPHQMHAQHLNSQIQLPMKIHQMQGLESSPYKESFEVFIQTLVSQALDPNFIMEITKENDEYFVNSIRDIQQVNDGFKNKLTINLSWGEILRQCIHCFPCTNVVPLKMPTNGYCQGCHSPALKRLVQFHGQPYDYATLQTLMDVPPAMHSAAEGFNLCGLCTDAIELYTKLHHSKYDLYGRCVAKVNEIRCRDLSKESHEILEECLQDTPWICVLYRHLESLWLKVATS